MKYRNFSQFHYKAPALGLFCISLILAYLRTPDPANVNLNQFPPKRG